MRKDKSECDCNEVYMEFKHVGPEEFFFVGKHLGTEYIYTSYLII
jgi:hypothetical protein